MKFTVGADPEFFLKDGKGRLISAHDVVPGTKAEPFKVPCGAVQADGTAVEFNIDPANSAEEFEHNIHEVLNWIRRYIPSRYSFDFTPVRKYTPKYWAELPEKAKEVGCDPELNLYHRHPRPPQDKWRGAGGHIHLGWCKDKDVNDPHHKFDCETITKYMCNHLGNLQSIWDNKIAERRAKTGYGYDKTYRVKSYGVEYRTLSCAWITRPDLYQWIFNMSQAACNNALKGNNVFSSLYDVHDLGWSAITDKDLPRPVSERIW